MNPKIYREIKIRSEKKVFVFFHGMFGDSNGREIRQARDYVLKKGYSACVFDYPGHGKSKGNLSEISLKEIYATAIDVINSLNAFEDIYLVGYSFGANPLIYIASESKKIRGIILLNPATDMVELVFRKSTHDDLDKYTKKHRKVSLLVKLRFFLELLVYNTYRYAKKIDCKVYVYHIKNDKSVPVTQSKKLEKLLKVKKRFVYVNGSNHSLKKELENGEFKARIFPEAFDWIMN